MATVAKTPRTSSYTLASAGSGPFLVGFRLFDDDALDVHVNGIRATNFSITTDLSIGYDDNATITFDAALDASDEIQIDGALVPGRDADYLSSDPGMARKLNAELARLWSSVSEISMKVGRTARSLSPLGAFVPVAGRVVVFTADSIEAGPTVDEVENAQAAADSANADALIAVGAAVSAAAAADQVQGVLDSFSYAYLGAKAAEPTLDNEGGPLVIGMLYFNTSVSEMRIYDSITPWISYTASETALAKGNNLSDLLNVVAARANLGLGTAATTAATAYATAAQGALADTALQSAPDTQTQLEWDTGTSTTEALISPAKLNAKFNVTGTAPTYACRAWVNFNGTGTVAIRAAGNVSSITDNGTGDYTVNFTTAMPDANYAVVVTPTRNRTDRPKWIYHLQPNAEANILTTSVRLMGGYVSGTSDGSYNAVSDFPQVSVAIFR